MVSTAQHQWIIDQRGIKAKTSSGRIVTGKIIGRLEPYPWFIHAGIDYQSCQISWPLALRAAQGKAIITL